MNPKTIAKLSKVFSRKLFLIVGCGLLLTHTALFAADNNPQAILHTNQGDITFELLADKAPITVANFLSYARDGFYNGTIFHRVIPRFMVQGGGFNEKMMELATKAPIINESDNGVHNDRWTVAMARTNDPNSASSQFFINTVVNSYLDAQGGKPGYAVFAKVIDGQEVVKTISKIPTQNVGANQNVPLTPIIITSVEIIDGTKANDEKTAPADNKKSETAK